MRITRQVFTAAALLAAATLPVRGQDARLERLKAEAATKVEARAKLVQEIIDQVFSFGELGMQEFETSKYLTGLLEKNGFRIERGIVGIPTAWTATWGSGKPVIALGSDIDGIPQSNQKPGVGYRDAIIGSAPGHGEGHNSGQAVNIAAALVVKEIMERERIPGTLILWPGVAEETVATKAHYVRAGIFKDVDVNLFTHVGNNLGVSWGQSGSNALLSVIFKFRGQTAHSAGAPWRGKSALDAVMLMAQAWEFKREHLELPQRSHYVIPDGGDQPNVVPQTASIWFYFRERDYPRTMAMFEAAKKMAQGAALMTDTQVDSINIVGSAWSGHFNKIDRRGDVREHQEGRVAEVGRRTTSRWRRGSRRSWVAARLGLETEIDSIGRAGERGDPHGRRLGRHRRRLVEHADGDAPVSVEHPGAAGAQLGERDLDGDADRAQGRRGGREGPGDDAAGHSADAEGRHAMPGTTSVTCRRRRRNTRRSSGLTTSRRSGSTRTSWRSTATRCGSTTTILRSTSRIWTSSGSSIRW